MSDKTSNKIKEFLKTLPKDTKISLETYLDYNYKSSGTPQINLVVTIQNSTGSWTYNEHNRDSINWEFLPNNISMWFFKNFIINRCKSVDKCNVKVDYSRGINTYKINNVLISELI